MIIISRNTTLSRKSDEDKKYPYLGIFKSKQTPGRYNIVLFTSENTGISLDMNWTDKEEKRIFLKLSKEYVEDMFEYFDGDITLRNS